MFLWVATMAQNRVTVKEHFAERPVSRFAAEVDPSGAFVSASAEERISLERFSLPGCTTLSRDTRCIANKDLNAEKQGTYWNSATQIRVAEGLLPDGVRSAIPFLISG